MPTRRRATALVVLALLLVGCRVDVAGEAVPAGHHRMPDGTLMADAGVGGHDHAVPDPADFPQGVVPIRLVIPRIGLDATVVTTSMTAGSIQGPPVAGAVAWLEQTRRPGEIGPAVLGGVDVLDREPGAYAGLGELSRGDEFAVLGEDGDLSRYRVETNRTTPVAERDAIFRAGGARPEVRLVDWALGDESTDRVVTAFAVGADD